MVDMAVVAVLVVPVSWVSQGGFEQPCCPAMLEVAVVAVLVVPVSWVSHGGFEQTRTTLPFCCPTGEVTREAAASCLSQTNCTWAGWECPPRLATTVVVAVLVVPVSWVSHGGLEHTSVTVPGCTSPWPESAMVTVAVGCSVVGEARMDTGRSCTGWASTPLGAVIRVTWVGWETGWGRYQTGRVSMQLLPACPSHHPAVSPTLADITDLAPKAIALAKPGPGCPLTARQCLTQRPGKRYCLASRAPGTGKGLWGWGRGGAWLGRTLGHGPCLNRGQQQMHHHFQEFSLRCMKRRKMLYVHEGEFSHPL